MSVFYAILQSFARVFNLIISLSLMANLSMLLKCVANFKVWFKLKELWEDVLPFNVSKHANIDVLLNWW